MRGILQRGGTILGTSRRDPYVHGDGYASVRRTVESNGIDARRRDRRRRHAADGARASSEEGLPVVGVPKTIDNDIAGTDMTFGFDTAVSIATEALDRISTTAESHNRIMVVEVMGRTKGWIATYAGIAAGADAILVPETRDRPRRRSPRRSGRATATATPTRSSSSRRAVAPPGGESVSAGIDAFGFERLGGVGYASAPSSSG